MRFGFYLDTFCIRGTTRAAIEYMDMLSSDYDIILFSIKTLYPIIFLSHPPCYGIEIVP